MGGQSNTGTGIAGFSNSGIGVFGVCRAGTGVRALGKTALKVEGPAMFSRSGVLTVAAGHSTAKKTGIALTAASLGLASIQGNVAGCLCRE